MKKSIITFLMAALILAAVSPAYAAGDKDAYSTEIEALCQLPEIVVTLPQSGAIYINPYRLPVEIDGESTQNQIVSEPGCIENGSEVPLSVTLSLSGSPKEGSDLRLSGVPTEGLGTIKRAFLYFEIKAVSDPDGAVWANEYDPDQHVIVRTTNKTKKNIITLDAADGENPYGAFHVSGDCAVAPKKGWVDGVDGVDITIMFTFTPLKRPG